MACWPSAYPVQEKGSFHCSDPLFEEIYRVGCRTNQICRQTYHMDSPIHQEPLGCMGDYRIESLMNYVSFGDPYLTRFDCIKIAWYLESHGYKMFHPSYCLLYVGMVKDYVLYSGDISILKHTQRAIHGTLELFLSYLGDNLLIEKAPNYMFMDWVPEGEWNRHHPPKCMGQGYLTAMLVDALDSAVFLFQTAGAPEKTYAAYRTYKEAIAQAIHRHLWVEKKGLYRDGLYDPGATHSSRWLPADVNRVFYSQHMNTLAVLYDIAPKDKQRAIMEQVMTNAELAQAQPYFLHFVLDALDHAGLFETYGLQVIARWKALLEENPDSLKEVWHGFDCDYSHAWSGTPTYQLPDKILGVKPLEPGFRKALFRPCLPPELTFASGRIPTPYGCIAVHLSRKQGVLAANLEAPAGVTIVRSTE